jgi:hypothetical protein
MKFLKIFGITIGAIIVIAVLVLGYFGFVPGVSNLFGSNQPKDLGVTYTEADYASAHAKNGTTHTILPSSGVPENSIKFSGQHPVDTTYTQSEFNALINYRQWEYYPLKECQFKIHPDGTLEFTGIVIKSRIMGYMEAIGVNESSLKTVTNYLKYIPGDAAFYASGKFEITNGQIVGTDIETFKVGNLNLTSQMQNNLSSVISGVYSQINAYPGFTVKTLTFKNGQVQFEGTLPDSARSISQ